jgi:hypothetical protein
MTDNRILSTLVDSTIAGKNVLTNGDFQTWDSGTSISTTNDQSFMSGWFAAYNGSFATSVISRQSFTIGNEIPGYESPYYLRWTTTSPTSNAYAYIGQKIPDVRTFAGQTVTLSGWIKASGSISGNYLQLEQNFGNGGTASYYSGAIAPTITTSWQRVTHTLTLPSISGKTLGPSNFLKVQIVVAGNQAFTVDTWGWQLELGSVATNFSPGPSNISISLDPANSPSLAGAGGWTGYQVAGKNAIINGGFDFWQRGTSFSTNAAYTADRWVIGINNTTSLSQQTFTPGAAPVAGYEGTYFARLNRTVRPTAFDDYFIHRIEDVRTFAGQTVTLSFWAKSSASTVLSGAYLEQWFGTGGSTSPLYVDSTGTLNLTTSWQRFTKTFTVPSISGKTIGTGSYLALTFVMANNIGATGVYDIWGVQLERGSVATPFSRAGGTIQGELAACQRYYEAQIGNMGFVGSIGSGIAYYAFGRFQVQKRSTSNVTIATTGVSGFPASNAIAEQINTSGFRTYLVSNASTSNGFYINNWTADCEL